VVDTEGNWLPIVIILRAGPETQAAVSPSMVYPYIFQRYLTQHCALTDKVLIIMKGRHHHRDIFHLHTLL
jgi:hypothetical protein